MKRLMGLICLLMVFSCGLMAGNETPPQPVLEKGDVARFVKTFPVIRKEMEALGAEFKSGEPLTFPEAVKANADIMAILTKNGWDERFWIKAATIAMGMASVQASEVDFNQALKDIEDNPHISQEMKEQLVQQVLTAKGMLSKNVHVKDLMMIRPHMEKLKTVLDTEEGK